ncbi:MAG: bis(5'-nucleosyl)-tetraphosphatase (symmetrical) YqeK, partial [Lachnospiraceae bacterium]|nr:bis(5'-nucleosyl)-tetraphosphatase (symmetrical) YqeK [Lachnospiraceae bacterium]
PTKEKLEKARKHGLAISKFEEKNPDMLHGKLGAYYAKARYEVDDEEILDAITYHTTGRPNMTLLDKIIFVADYIEPNRKELKDMDIIRREAFVDIDVCVIHILKNTLDYLNNSTNEMDFMTQLTYNYYVNK